MFAYTWIIYFYIESSRAMFKKFKESMIVEFVMSNMGMMHYFLGIDILQSVDGNFVPQQKYV